MSHRRCAVVCALASVLLVVPAAAFASQTGGLSGPGTPRVKVVACLGSTSKACETRQTVVRGQEFVVRGRNLDRVKRVIFGGRRTRRDNTAASVARSSGRYVVAEVPMRARSGPVLLLGSGRTRLARVRRVRVRRAPKVKPLDIAPGASFFYAGRRKATFSFDVQQATVAQVALINEESQEVVRTWSVPAQPGVRAQVRWGGRSKDGVVPTGRYVFRLVGAASSAVTTAPESTTEFFFGDHLFPIRGRHNLGYTPTNNFGGGGGRAHQGQDMFARCGTRLAAARGGKVQYAGYHSAAGNYLVIDGAGTGADYVYMHMREPALVKTGDRVFTGQKVGAVGETGRATGCHLHFELWSAPGWYQGGRAIDPLPALKVWDSYS
ncbi:MAG: M23 family metallopeptidase [Thermoleophilaceae bacterium]